MSDTTPLVQKLFVMDEEIKATATELQIDIRYSQNFITSSRVEPFADSDRPQHSGQLLLTNKRLIVSEDWISKDFNMPKHNFSVKVIYGLAERFPLFSDKNPWPYQAKLYLPNELVLVVETQPKEFELRGTELSRFLNLALDVLGAKP